VPLLTALYGSVANADTTPTPVICFHEALSPLAAMLPMLMFPQMLLLSFAAANATAFCYNAISF